MKLSKKIISVLLSVLLVVASLPITAITVFAGSTEKTATSVAFVSEYGYDYFDEETDSAYYFDTVQDAVDYAISQNELKTISILKDVELSEPVIVDVKNNEPDKDGNMQAGLYIELNENKVTAPTGDAFKVLNVSGNSGDVYFDFWQYFCGVTNTTISSGGIEAKGYAVDGLISDDYGQIRIYGGYYKSDDMTSPIHLDEDTYYNPYLYYSRFSVCCGAILNTTYDEGYFDDSKLVSIFYNVEGNVFSNKHVTEENWDGDVAYVVASHDSGSEFTQNYISADHKTATFKTNCSCGTEVIAACTVGDKAFLNFENAIASVANGATATIELCKDFTAVYTFAIKSEKNITLNLNGHTYSQDWGYIDVENAKLDVNGPGKINGNSDSLFYVQGVTSNVTNATVININEGVEIDNTFRGNAGDIACAMLISGASKPYGVVVTLNGVTMNSKGNCIATNGMFNKETANAPTVNIYDSTLTADISALYIAGYTNMEIERTSLEGYVTAAEFRGGNVVIRDSKLTAYAVPSSTESNDNGSTTTGAALAVAQHVENYRHTINIQIYDTEMTAFNPVKQSNPENGTKEDISRVNVDIYSGSFNAVGDGSVDAVKADNQSTVVVHGGEFSTTPVEYLAPEKGVIVSTNELGETVYEVRNRDPFNSENLTLDDSVDHNFYLDAEYYLGSCIEDATVEITYNDNRITYDKNEVTVTKDVSELETVENNGVTQYLISTEDCTPAQLTENIKIDLYDKNGEKVFSNIKTTKATCDYYIEHNMPTAELSKALINYAAKAQTYFEYNENDLVGNEYVTELEGDMAAVTPQSISATASMSGNAIAITDIAFVSHANSAIRFYHDADVNVNDYELKVEMPGKLGDQKLTAYFAVAQSGHYIAVSGIESVNLDNNFILTIKNKKTGEVTTISYSAMAFCKTMIAKANDQKVIDFCKSVVLYNRAAENYFD